MMAGARVFLSTLAPDYRFNLDTPDNTSDVIVRPTTLTSFANSVARLGLVALFSCASVLAQTKRANLNTHAAHVHTPADQSAPAHDAHMHIEDDVELKATAFTTEPGELPSAQPVQTIELNDGDEFNITADYVKKAVGNRTLRMLTYNGSVPGPFIRAPQGAEITLHFTNKTDIDQTIHSDGIRVDKLSDGVPGLTQDKGRPPPLFLKWDNSTVFSVLRVFTTLN